MNLSSTMVYFKNYTVIEKQMRKQGYILSVDQGTTGTTGIIMDEYGNILWKAYQEIRQLYPMPGWVEHNPLDLFNSCINIIEELLDETEISLGKVLALGITNQRETTIVWDRTSGKPVHNAIVWQCRRTAGICEDLKNRGLEDEVRSKTGLTIDGYFSATKIRWILDNIPNGQRRAENGELAFGTVDSWIIWNLTNGTVHSTDVTNASRTMIFNINTLDWDDDLLSELNIPKAILPKVCSSNEIHAYAGGNFFGGHSPPISGVIGDQNASLFGQVCFSPGMTKNTYGTGSFILMNTGKKRLMSVPGLLTTPAWCIDNDVTFALEGSIFSTGSSVQWLKDELSFFSDVEEIEALAEMVDDNGGVYIVPAFTGLGSPHWDMEVRGAIFGITRGTNKGHISRAILESTAYQTKDVLDRMINSTNINIPRLRVDGGGTNNDLLMRIQAEVLDLSIEVCSITETTALGAGYLAGLGIGLWNTYDQITELWESSSCFMPSQSSRLRDVFYTNWQKAVASARGWRPL